MINNKDITIWVDLSELPRKGNRIIWKNSVGHKLKFKYDCVNSYINIVKYEKKGVLYITIKDYVDEPVRISPNSVMKGCFSHLLANRIVDKTPDIIPYLADKKDAYKYSYQSNKKVKLKCPFCGKESEQYLNNIYKRGFYCECFSDGISLPNKLMINILNQLHIDYKREVGKSVFPWIGEYYYDFYFNTDSEKNILLEMDGRYHDEKDCIQRDTIKNQLARDNGFKLIRIDCRYRGDPIKYIQSNILNSELKDILSLDSVDWDKCKNVYKNQVMLQACELWETTLCTISDIAFRLKMDSRTIAKYLKRGVMLGLCPSYSYSEAQSRSSSRQIAIMDDNKISRVFFNSKEAAEILQNEMKIKFTAKGISNCAYGYNKTYRDLIFKHITREEYEQYKMIKNNEVVLKEDDVA